MDRKPEDVAFGERLLTTLQKLKLSQKSFAEKAGVPQGVVSKLVNGAGGYSATTIKSIAKAFPDLDMDWLVTGTEKESDDDGYIKMDPKKIIQDLQQQIEQKDKIINHLINIGNNGSTQTGAFGS